LGAVLRLGGVAGETQAQSVDARRKRSIERLERAHIARARVAQQRALVESGSGLGVRGRGSVAHSED